MHACACVRAYACMRARVRACARAYACMRACRGIQWPAPNPSRRRVLRCASPPHGTSPHHSAHLIVRQLGLKGNVHVVLDLGPQICATFSVWGPGREVLSDQHAREGPGPDATGHRTPARSRPQPRCHGSSAKESALECRYPWQVSMRATTQTFRPLIQVLDGVEDALELGGGVGGACREGAECVSESERYDMELRQRYCRVAAVGLCSINGE